MRWGSVLWFSDHPRPFLVKEIYCTDPGCNCSEVGLTLHEVSDCGNEISQPISLGLQVDLATWKERKPPERSPQAASWVRQFLSQFPADRRAELKARSEESKQKTARIAQYTIDPDDVTNGVLFSYTDLLEDQGSLSSGGPGYTFGLAYQNGEYLIEDMYCPQPACDCREVHLRFWKAVTQLQDGTTRGHIEQMFLGKVTFDGKRTVATDADCLPDVAEAILGAWWDCHQDDLPMLKKRYEDVKRIGFRSLNVTAASSVIRPLNSDQFPTLSVDSSVEEFLEDEPQFSQRRVGRNDPCPCGSGVKFKRCCGKPK